MRHDDLTRTFPSLYSGRRRSIQAVTDSLFRPCSSWYSCKWIGLDPDVRHESHSALKSVVQALHSYDHPRFLRSSTNLLDLAAERASLSKASLAPSRLAQHSVAVPAHHNGLRVAEDRGAVKKETKGNASVSASRHGWPNGWCVCDAHTKTTWSKSQVLKSKYVEIFAEVAIVCAHRVCKRGEGGGGVAEAGLTC